jgi:hypothetical protein
VISAGYKGGRDPKKPCAPLVQPSAGSTASASATTYFRGSITRPAHSLSTLRRRPRGRPRKTRFRLAINLCRAARTTPPGASGGFRDDHPLIASSSSRLPWRTDPEKRSVNPEKRSVITSRRPKRHR